MSENGDHLDCDECGVRISTTEDAFAEDAENNLDYHIDCDDPKGYNQMDLNIYTVHNYTSQEIALLVWHDRDEELHAFFPREDTEDDAESVAWEVCGECGDTPEGLMHNNTWRNVEPLMEGY